MNNTPNNNTTKSGWKNWILPFVIAFALAFWSVVFALFFLAVVWVMRLNPKTDSKENLFPSDDDRKRAKGTYTWLLLSPFLNVIIFALASFNLDYNSSANERVMAALIPLLFHLPVLLRLDSKSPFMFRHTQQAILLLALRASMAALALNISKYPDEGIWLFFLGNGFLWLVGSLWGRSQAHRGTCWWMKRKGEVIQSKDGLIAPSAKTEASLQKTPEKFIEYGNWYLKNNQRDSAKQYSLQAFRSGDSNIRSQAIRMLNELGEVEKF
jgi:hypothetical protein